MPWFNCLDEIRGSRMSFSDESHSKENVPFVFNESTVDGLPINFDSLNLFEFNFDKGTAVIEELGDIFKMTR